jgi:hypothetical protein
MSIEVRNVMSMPLNTSTAVIVINIANMKTKKIFSEKYLDRENELLLLTNPNTFMLDYRIKCILYGIIDSF